MWYILKPIAILLLVAIQIALFPPFFLLACVAGMFYVLTGKETVEKVTRHTKQLLNDYWWLW